MQQQQQQWYILGRVGVCECGRQHGQRVRKDDHADDDGHDHGEKAATVMRADVAVTGSGHSDDGEVQRRHVAIARRHILVDVETHRQPAVRVTSTHTVHYATELTSTDHDRLLTTDIPAEQGRLYTPKSDGASSHALGDSSALFWGISTLLFPYSLLLPASSIFPSLPHLKSS